MNFIDCIDNLTYNFLLSNIMMLLKSVWAFDSYRISAADILVHNKDKPWFDDQCRRAFDLKQEAHLRWTCDCSRVNWEEFVRC